MTVPAAGEPKLYDHDPTTTGTPVGTTSATGTCAHSPMPTRPVTGGPLALLASLIDHDRHAQEARRTAYRIGSPPGASRQRPTGNSSASCFTAAQGSEKTRPAVPLGLQHRRSPNWVANFGGILGNLCDGQLGVQYGDNLVAERAQGVHLSSGHRCIWG